MLLNCCGKVQELHGSPWVAKRALGTDGSSTSRNYSVPDLSSSFSTTSTAESVLLTPMSSQSPTTEVFEAQLFTPTPDEGSFTYTKRPKAGKPASRRRASHDLFECIEQSPGKRLPEHHAKLVFRQVVEAVWYLNRKGIIHCDIKDENILVDTRLRVCLFYSLPSSSRIQLMRGSSSQGETHRFWQCSHRRSFEASAILRRLLRHDSLRIFRSFTETSVSCRAGRGLDPRRSAFVSPHGKLSVPDGR